MVGPLASALYEGRVEHARRAPRPHRFGYRVGLVYLDLDEVDAVLERAPLWSRSPLAPVRFRRADYLGDPERPLKESVLDLVEERLGRRPDGAVRMLTQLRTWGYVFNPVSFYYAFDANDELEAVVAEITNTPWRERHAYVLDTRSARVTNDAEGDADKEGRAFAWSFDKDFHVSPFFPMEQRYAWTFGEPGERLVVRMANTASNENARDRSGEAVFHADLVLRRRELTAASAVLALLRHPLLTFRVHAAIYWQALRLHLKRTPFFVHPRKRVATGDALR